MALEVNTTMVMVRITPMSAGTICTAVRFSGLYSVRTSTRGGVMRLPPEYAPMRVTREQRHAGEAADHAGDGRLRTVDQDLRHRPRLGLQAALEVRRDDDGHADATFAHQRVDLGCWSSCVRATRSTCVASSSAMNSRDIEVLAWSWTTVARWRTSKLMA